MAKQKNWDPLSEPVNPACVEGETDAMFNYLKYRLKGGASLEAACLRLTQEIGEDTPLRRAIRSRFLERVEREYEQLNAYVQKAPISSLQPIAA